MVYCALRRKSWLLVNLTPGGGYWIPPVGFVWLSTENVSPAIYFENTTWELISQNRVLMGAGDGHNGGDTVEAGLPNITGEMNGLYGELSDGKAASALYGRSGVAKWTNEVWKNFKQLGFDASRSNSIYGRSTTVQPPAFYVYMYRRAS